MHEYYDFCFHCDIVLLNTWIILLSSCGGGGVKISQSKNVSSLLLLLTQLIFRGGMPTNLKCPPLDEKY